MSTLPNIKLFADNQDPERDRILLIPGYLFFVQSVSVEEELTAPDLASLAQLTLEGLTPFPLEQLVWGYAQDLVSRHLLIFAAYQERLKGAGYSNLERFRQVYPDFLVLTNESQTEPATYFHVTRDGVTAAQFPAGARFPLHLHSLPRDLLEGSEAPAEEAPEDTLTVEALHPEERQAFGDFLDEAAFPERDTLTQQVSAYPTDAGSVRFSLDGKTYSELKEENLWSADLRPSAFANRVRTQRRRDHFLWKWMNWAAILVLVFLCLEGLRLTGAVVVNQRLQKIENREEKVANLASRNELVNRLELRASGQLRPFSTLSVMNRTRPETLYFTTIEAGDINRFIVEGIASNPNEVNRYAESLREMGYFESVLQQNNRVVSGQVTFTLRLVIDEVPAAQTEVAQKEENP